MVNEIIHEAIKSANKQNTVHYLGHDCDNMFIFLHYMLTKIANIRTRENNQL